MQSYSRDSIVLDTYFKEQSGCSKKMVAFAISTVVTAVLGVLAQQGYLGGKIPDSLGGPNMGLYLGVGIPFIAVLVLGIKEWCCRRNENNAARDWLDDPSPSFGDVESGDEPETSFTRLPEFDKHWPS